MIQLKILQIYIYFFFAKTKVFANTLSKFA